MIVKMREESKAALQMNQSDKVAALKKLVDEKVKQYAWKGDEFYDRIEQATKDQKWLETLLEHISQDGIYKLQITKEQMLRMNKMYKYWKRDGL